MPGLDENEHGRTNERTNEHESRGRKKSVRASSTVVSVTIIPSNFLFDTRTRRRACLCVFGASLCACVCVISRIPICSVLTFPRAVVFSSRARMQHCSTGFPRLPSSYPNFLARGTGLSWAVLCCVMGGLPAVSRACGALVYIVLIGMR